MAFGATAAAFPSVNFLLYHAPETSAAWPSELLEGSAPVVAVGTAVAVVGTLVVDAPPPPAPAAAPDRWEEFATAEGAPYYFNAATGVTSWTKPEPVAPSAGRDTATAEPAASTSSVAASSSDGPQRRIDDDGEARTRGEFLMRHGREEGRRRWREALRAAGATVATQSSVVRALRASQLSA